MDTTSLFTAALQLPDPWRVSGVEFRDEEDGRRELHIAIGFAAGSRFPCPEPGCGEAACPVHDARERVWRHLNFFQYKAFIHAGVPRVTCPAHGVHAVPVPWARPGSGFTLLFEAMVVELAKSQPVADIAEQVGEHDTRLWRFIRHYVDEARLYEDYTGVEAIGIAKASAASGFEAAVRAGEHLVEQGHAIDEASVTTMARRIAAGEKPYEQSVPDLTGYDVFMKPRQPWERKEA